MVNTERYAPDFMVSVSPNDGTGTDLRNLLSDYPIDILSVTITETVDRADTFAFTLRSRPKPLERFPNGNEMVWLDNNSLKPGTWVTIQMGYVGNRTVKMVGKIKATNFGFADGGSITVRVDGQSLYGDLFQRHRRKPFADKTDSAIANEIASELKLQAKVDPTNIQYATVSNRDESYASILQARAKRLYFELTVKEKTLYFQQPSYLKDTNPALTLIWGEDLLNFNPRINTNGLPTQVAVRNMQTSHGGAKQPIVGIVAARNVPARLGKRSGPQIVQEMFGDNHVLSVDQQVSTPEEATAVATAQLRSKAISFIEGQGATIGNPKLVSRQVIELQRLGKQMSGLYYVTSTTHTIDANGYRTDFQVNRDGI